MLERDVNNTNGATANLTTNAFGEPYQMRRDEAK